MDQELIQLWARQRRQYMERCCDGSCCALFGKGAYLERRFLYPFPMVANNGGGPV